MSQRVRSRYRLTNVRSYRRPIGRTCLHCGRWAYHRATVTERRRGGFTREVVYCDDHLAIAQEAYQ